MEPLQIRIQVGLKFSDRHPICAACALIGANALPRKLQVLARVDFVHQRVDLLLLTFERRKHVRLLTPDDRLGKRRSGGVAPFDDHVR
jgi:hypothetical protein